MIKGHNKTPFQTRVITFHCEMLLQVLNPVSAFTNWCFGVCACNLFFKLFYCSFTFLYFYLVLMFSPKVLILALTNLQGWDPEKKSFIFKFIHDPVFLRKKCKGRQYFASTLHFSLGIKQVCFS
jgi:hypothetical protein